MGQNNITTCSHGEDDLDKAFKSEQLYVLEIVGD